MVIPTLFYVFPFLFADERDKVQKKTFTKWINQHLMKVSCALTCWRGFARSSALGGAMDATHRYECQLHIHRGTHIVPWLS